MTDKIEIISLGSITENDVEYYFLITATEHDYQELGRGLCALSFFSKYDAVILLNLHENQPATYHLFRGYDRDNERIVDFMDLYPLCYYKEFLREWRTRETGCIGFEYNTETKSYKVKSFGKLPEKYTICLDNECKWTDHSYKSG